MIYPLISTENPFFAISAKIPRVQESTIKPIYCSSIQNRNPNSTINKFLKLYSRTGHALNPKIVTTDSSQVCFEKNNRGRRDFGEVGIKQMLVLCGLGYWVQGFRCFPWLALNFHMAHNLSFHPSTLQLVQNSGNLPMVAKPLYGILSDALYIGVLLQILSWGPLALFPVACKALPTLMAYLLLSNLGASITEVAKDALVAEYGQKHGMVGLQSYAFMAAGGGGILGNLLGGYFLPKTLSTTMFLIFATLLSLQLAISLSVREEHLGLAQPSYNNVARKSISESIKKQLSDLIMAIGEENISRPLTWLVASVAMVLFFRFNILLSNSMSTA